jgi:hypothetical protein
MGAASADPQRFDDVRAGSCLGVTTLAATDPINIDVG